MVNSEPRSPSEIARQVHAAAEVSRIAEPGLIDQSGVDCPGVIEIQILLLPVELLNVPRNVAVRQTGGRIQRGRYCCQTCRNNWR